MLGTLLNNASQNFNIHLPVIVPRYIAKPDHRLKMIRQFRRQYPCFTQYGKNLPAVLGNTQARGRTICMTTSSAASQVRCRLRIWSPDVYSWSQAHFTCPLYFYVSTIFFVNPVQAMLDDGYLIEQYIINHTRFPCLVYPPEFRAALRSALHTRNKQQFRTDRPWFRLCNKFAHHAQQSVTALLLKHDTYPPDPHHGSRSVPAFAPDSIVPSWIMAGMTRPRGQYRCHSAPAAYPNCQSNKLLLCRAGGCVWHRQYAFVMARASS